MEDVTFLDQEAATVFDMPAILMVLLPDGSVTHISDINPFRLLDKCPLLFHAFESRESGHLQQANIEATSRAAVISLLRFLYTGTYLINQEECMGLLLPHAEVFKIAEDFHVPELQVQAYVNFNRDAEFSCCSALPPPDICATIGFVYQYLGDVNSEEHQSLLDTLLNYCVSVFTYQSLGMREDFRTTVFENAIFHQDLCKTSLRRGFDADGASDIMQLPVCHPIPHSQALLSKQALGDFQYELWMEGEPSPGTDDFGSDLKSPKKRKPSHGAFTLVHRPMTTDGIVTYVSGESDSDSSGEECTLVHRPRKPLGGLDFVSDESEFESFSDQEGYHLIRHPKSGHTGNSASSNFSASSDTLNCPVACDPSSVLDKTKDKGEPRDLGSDSDWDLI